MDRKGFERVVTICACGLLALAVASLFYLARELILPVFLAVFIALVLQPIVRRFCRLGMNRPAAAVATMLIVLAILIGGGYRLTAPAIDWLDRVPTITQKIESRFHELRRSLAAAEQASEQIQEITQGDQGEDSDTVVVAEESFARNMLGQIGSFMGQAGITVGLLFFLLAFGQPTAERVIQAFELRDTRRRLREITRDVERRCAEYLRTVTLINMGVGIATGLAMWALHVPNAPLWGILAMALNYMPYLGPTVMVGILGAVGIVTFEEPLAMAAPLFAFMTITAIEGQFITPAIVGRQLTLNPIAVFLAIVVWFWIWGVAGAIIAVPLLASVKIVADQLPALSPLSAFLGRPVVERNRAGTETKPTSA